MSAGDGHRRRPRRLNEHEAALWREVTRQIAPLRPAPAHPEPAPEVHAPARPAPPENSMQRAPVPAAPKSPPPLAPIDRRFRNRLARGLEPVEARLDLHGMRQNEAHGALLGFLRQARVRGLRNVLVITGKGGPLGLPHEPGAERGVLRRQAPLWLRLPELRDIVLGFEQATPNHGGEGALYVRLRRGRGVTE